MEVRKPMREKGKGNAGLHKHGIGFVACYKDQEIAFARDFDVLVNKPIVKERLGQQDLIIKHNVPEGIIAVY